MKLNGIEKGICKAVMENKIAHEKFTTIINKEKKYHELKESIRIIKNARK